MGPKDIWGKSKQVEGRASAKALGCEEVWCVQGMAKWPGGVQGREDSGFDQGGSDGGGEHSWTREQYKGQPMTC